MVGFYSHMECSKEEEEEKEESNSTNNVSNKSNYFSKEIERRMWIEFI